VAGRLALAVALAAALLPVAGAGGATAQTPKRAGVVVIGTIKTFEPLCLRPFDDDCGQFPLGFPLDLSHVLPGAFEVVPGATFRADLVSGARIVSTKPFTLVYRIRPEARWSDGTPVSAQDFEFTHQVLREHAPTADESAYVRNVRKLSRKTVRVQLRTRYVDWRYLFDFILPRHVLAGQDLTSVWRDGIDNPRTGSAIGSGPFLVAGWSRGEQLTFVRNRRYWGQHTAYLDRVAYRFLAPAEPADALRQGAIDMIQFGPVPLDAQHRELRRRPAPGIRVVAVPSNGFEHVTIRVADGGHPALQSRLVRQALAYGIDRVAIARAIGQLSYAGPSTSGPQDSMVFARTSRYYQASWSIYRRSEARARALLAQAGCRPGADAIYICGGVRLTLRLGTPAGTERRELTVRLVQEQLRRVGIDVVLEFAPGPIFFAKVQRGDFDLASFAWFPGALTGGPGGSLACQREENLSGYCDRLITRDLLRAESTLNLSRRVELLNRIDRRLARAVPHIPLYQLTGNWAFAANVRGVEPNSAGENTWNVEDWWLDD
jgi:peptide/nickel transport system substrate-binding protein